CDCHRGIIYLLQSLHQRTLSVLFLFLLDLLLVPFLYPYPTLFRSSPRLASRSPPEYDRPAPVPPALPAHPLSPRVIPVERRADRSEEHTSELQSRENLVCRLLLEKKNK